MPAQNFSGTIGKKYKIFWKMDGPSTPPGFDGSDPEKFFVAGTYGGVVTHPSTGPMHRFNDLAIMDPSTLITSRLNNYLIPDRFFSESGPDSKYKIIEVNPESGALLTGGRRRRTQRRRGSRKSKRGSCRQ